MTRLFLCGAFLRPPLLEALLGRRTSLHPARLQGWRAAEGDDDGGWHPVLGQAPGAVAEGAIVTLDAPDDLARLNFFRDVFGHGLSEVTADEPAGPVDAMILLAQSAGSVASASSEDDAYRAAALAELLGLWPALPADRAAARWPQILQRQSSRQRAGAEPMPAGVRTGGGSVEIQARRQPYRGFFEVAEADLRFPRFDGTLSEPVTRAAFVMADAVTVLPYDPQRDRVMVVEQFRFGSLMRGDPLPWSVEPIAGRIDGGETPEATARREAREETGLLLDQLIPIGRYYPSPGATTEYLYSFLALCDLPDSSAGIGGLQDEAEDIRAILLSFERLMELLDGGLLEDGPLMLSALELARRRPGLREAP